MLEALKGLGLVADGARVLRGGLGDALAHGGGVDGVKPRLGDLVAVLYLDHGLAADVAARRLVRGEEDDLGNGRDRVPGNLRRVLVGRVGVPRIGGEHGGAVDVVGARRLPSAARYGYRLASPSTSSAIAVARLRMEIAEHALPSQSSACTMLRMASARHDSDCTILMPVGSTTGVPSTR